MKDVDGKELKIGDKVAYCVVGYSELCVGVISKFTPKACRIGKDVSCITNQNSQIRFGNQICKMGE